MDLVGPGPSAWGALRTVDTAARRRPRPPRLNRTLAPQRDHRLGARPSGRSRPRRKAVPRPTTSRGARSVLSVNRASVVHSSRDVARGSPASPHDFGILVLTRERMARSTTGSSPRPQAAKAATIGAVAPRLPAAAYKASGDDRRVRGRGSAQECYKCHRCFPDVDVQQLAGAASDPSGCCWEASHSPARDASCSRATNPG